MSWGEILTVAGTVAALLGVVAAALLPAMDERNRRKFAAIEAVQTPDGKPKCATREELQGAVERLEELTRRNRTSVERNDSLVVALDDRVGRIESTSTRLDERQSQESRRVSEELARTSETLREVMVEMKSISKTQQELALRLERLFRTP